MLWQYNIYFFVVSKAELRERERERGNDDVRFVKEFF